MKAFLKKILILATFLSLNVLWAQTEKEPLVVESDKLPQIKSLSQKIKQRDRNLEFEEYSQIVAENSMAIAGGRQPEYLFFKYTVTEKFTLLELCARCCINYDTIITLNSISSKDDSIAGKTLILPTFHGLFIPLDAGKNPVERLLHENYKNQNLTKRALYYRIDGRDYIFLTAKRLSPTERAFFLDSSLMLPLQENSFYVSSEFGSRKNPFSGQIKNHNGIDLAASEGTPVYAVKDGDVAYVFHNDPTFGNYIILSHDMGKQTSVYAHLSKACVEQYSFVRKGTLIGYVGHTGMATGDHLHFEIRTGGKAQNPRDKLDF